MTQEEYDQDFINYFRQFYADDHIENLFDFKIIYHANKFARSIANQSIQAKECVI